MKPMKNSTEPGRDWFSVEGWETNLEGGVLGEDRNGGAWSRLMALFEPFYPKMGNGRPPAPLSTMLRIHFLLQWICYSDPAMEEALHDVPLLRQFAGLDAIEDVMSDESTILRFRH